MKLTWARLTCLTENNKTLNLAMQSRKEIVTWTWTWIASYHWNIIKIWAAKLVKINEIVQTYAKGCLEIYYFLFSEFFKQRHFKVRAITDATKSGNGEPGTGNEREPGTGVWERVYSGNP